jgi:hypothetical protein|tara:strand:- start:281 stop:790 length:510 start_codon:yes stop_codon:yes gene_type:complete
MKKTDGGYRAWYYFRNGWSVYFAFIFAAINTLIITYYLAIERAPFLKEIFPSFGFYVIAAIGLGIPLLTIIGWVHWKKSGARRAEVDVNYEANPYEARTMVNTEMVLKLSLQLSEMLLKNQNQTNISEKEIDSIKNLIKDIEDHHNKRTFTNKMDIKYIRTETQERTSQ